MSANTLSERLRAAVRATTEEAGRFKKLAQESGIPEASWKSWWYRRQRPTVEMIEGVCRAAPQFALWIATGISDEDNGHLAPAEHFFPGRLRGDPMTPVETDATISYFKECLHAAEQIAGLKEEQITRLEKHIREGTVLEGVDDTNFPENPESTGHGLGYWLRDSGAAFFGKEVSQIMQTLARQQRLHREETITRLRRYNSDTDAIIDSQREEDEAIRKKFGID